MVNIESTNGSVPSFAAELHVLKDTVQLCNVRYDVLLAFKQALDSRRAQLPKKNRKNKKNVM